ncbi:MAG: hypothetical protein A4E28_00387 [Methanocella sp. PtaU1.Bin125]|nr:MAG: hypothetical protein A4E28_00387 [Methanocella sp. PtaU1.Bin125]
MGAENFRHTITIMVVTFAVVMAALAAGGQTDKRDMQSAWTQAEDVFGVTGDYHADGTATFDVPRKLTVTMNGVRLASGSDRAHEIRMMSVGDKAIAVGELVLTAEEIGGVTKKLLDAGISETALHNHLLHLSPGVMYLHFHAFGDPVDITTAINDVITPLGKSPESEFDNESLDTAKLDRIMGAEGRAGGGVYGYTVPRAGNVTVDGMTLSPHMDISTEITFQPLGDGKALAIGEFVLEAREVTPVIGELTEKGFEIDALHSHMLTEEPRLFYLHAWATGDAEQLASGLRLALEKTDSLTGPR